MGAVATRVIASAEAACVETARAEQTDCAAVAGEEPPDPGEKPRRSGARGDLTVDAVDLSRSLTAAEARWVSDHVALASGPLGVRGEVRIRFVDDGAMAAAHEQHMDVPGTTDVITFDLADGAAGAGGALDVDLLICVDEARRQSARRGIELERELLLYALHGVLHCLGHDDHDPAQARRMHELEDRALVALGLAPAYFQGETDVEH